MLYQIFLRSFVDFNGDGVGDLAGVTAQLDYLVKLGVDAVWLSPIYFLPMVDSGYDITDQCRIDPIFGTLEDFYQMLSCARWPRASIRVGFRAHDTFDRHTWFEQPLASRDQSRGAITMPWLTQTMMAAWLNNWRSVLRRRRVGVDVVTPSQASATCIPTPSSSLT